MRPAIYATGVTVVAGGATLLHGVDVTVAPGAWVNIIGPNGAGKSTLLRAIAGLTRASGRIEIAGTPLADRSGAARGRLLAVVAQRPAMPDDMTVEHYVLLGRTPHLSPLGAERDIDFAVVDRMVDLLSLTPLSGRRLATLSGGERQRVALARALAQEPSILLLDEPTAALDIGHQQEVLELVDQLRADLGLTVVTTMHDLTLAAEYGDLVVLLAAGRIVASGPPVQVLTGPHLATHYGARVDVIRHAGTIVVVPLRPPPRPSSADEQEEPDART